MLLHISLILLYVLFQHITVKYGIGMFINHTSTLLKGLRRTTLRTDHLTCRGGGMFFCFVQNCFFGQHESQNINFCYRAKREFFFQNATLGYMTNTLNQFIFFPSTKIRIFFSATLGIRIFIQKKKTYPSPSLLQVKWSFP